MKYKEWLDVWFANYIEPSSKTKTCERYSEIIEKHLKVKLGEYELEELSPIVIQKYIIELTVKIRRRRLFFAESKERRKSESVEIPIIRFVHVHAVFRVGGRPIFSRRRAHEFFEILIEIDAAFISRLNPHFVDG